MQQQGNHSIIRRLLDEHVRGLVLYARQWNTGHAEDVVQDAFLKLLTEDPFPEFPKAWLYRVVRNASIDRTRREKRFQPVETLENWFEFYPENRISGDEITRALESLSSGSREIVVSKIWGELTFREIAVLTDRPISSVHHDYQKAIDQLRFLLREE